MKRIWICGASGMLGSHFYRLLTKKKIPFIGTHSKEINITDLDQVSNFVRTKEITHIVNCAAYTQVDQAEVEPAQAYLINAIGPHQLGIAARRHGARVLHFSTDYVFDGKTRNSPYSENDLCSPISAYGMSKLAGEIKLLDECKNVCIIRTSWLFGMPGKNFVETMLSLMQQRDELNVVSDQVGRPTYCEDLAEAALAIIDQPGIFHFANALQTSWYEFAKEIHRQALELNYTLTLKNLNSIKTADYPTKAKRPAYSTLSTKKIENYLDRPPRTWQEALSSYLLDRRCSQSILKP